MHRHDGLDSSQNPISSHPCQRLTSVSHELPDILHDRSNLETVAVLIDVYLEHTDYAEHSR